MLYELLYFLKNPSKELEDYLTSLNNRIEKDSQQEYKIALTVQKEMLDYYNKQNPSFEKLQKKAKVLSRKYQRNNT